MSAQRGADAGTQRTEGHASGAPAAAGGYRQLSLQEQSDLELKSQGYDGQSRWRLRHVLVVGTMATAVLRLLAGLSPSHHAAAAVADVESAGELTEVRSGAKFWFFCAGFDNCSDAGTQRWRVSPKELAEQVPSDLGKLPGIPYGETVEAKMLASWRESPLHFRGRRITTDDVVAFMRELLADDPFGTGDEVPYEDFSDQAPKVAALTQRQLAFIVANALMGNTIPAQNGLSAALQRCAASQKKSHSADSSIWYSLLSFLAVLSEELKGGLDGSVLIAVTPRIADFKDKCWSDRLDSALLLPPNICNKVDGSCSMPDFMSGGPAFQALTDIAGQALGGCAGLCSVATTQEESLVQFYSETLAFAFFASAPPTVVWSPFVLLGARRYLDTIQGEARGDGVCGDLPTTDWLNKDIPTETTVVTLRGREVHVAPWAFVAVESSFGTSGCTGWQDRNNDCDAQRRHLDRDVLKWFEAFSPSMFPQPVRSAFAHIVRRAGTGPWGAGDWLGDSQQYFLATWLAASLAGVRLDYYIYDRFCENPGNQCFVLGRSGCAECLGKSFVESLDAGRCGDADIYSMVAQFKGRPARELYKALSNVPGPPEQVFDLLVKAGAVHA